MTDAVHEPFWPWEEARYDDNPNEEPEPCPLGWRDARCGRFGPCGCEPARESA